MADRTNSPEHKSPGLAAALSVILPGVGHIYVGEVGIGVTYIIAASIGYALFIIPGLIIAIVSAVHAHSSASDKNKDKIERGSIEVNKKTQESSQEEVKSEEFINRLKKLSKLYTHDILNKEEYKERKRQAISEIGRKKVDKEPEEFLFEIKELKDHILDREDIDMIKKRIL